VLEDDEVGLPERAQEQEQPERPKRDERGLKTVSNGVHRLG
jgi:hypothetical protein